MLIFIVTLQSREVCKDWERVSRICVRTLRSLCQQTVENYRVYLVCNQAPAGIFSRSNLQVLEVDVPVPNINVREECLHDKFRKLAYGLAEARTHAPAYIMPVDMDDLVRRDLAAYVAKHSLCHGWVMHKGFIYDEGAPFAYLTKNKLNALCGTSYIVYSEKEDLPETGDAPLEDYLLLANGHTVIEETCSNMRKPLHHLSFPGVVYMRSTGANISGFAMKNWRSRKMLLSKLLNYRWVSKSFRHRYGLWPL